MRNSRLCLLGGIAIALTAASGVAIGAKSGDQSLTLQAVVAPAKASTKGHSRPVRLEVRFDYNSLNDGRQIKETTQSVTLSLPPGMKLHRQRATVCKLSEMMKVDSAGQQAGARGCPAGSQVGVGAATADARPDIADPVPASIQLFNGLHDVNDDGTTRDPATPSVIVFAAANIGASTIAAMDMIANTLVLTYAQPPPGQPQLYHISKLHLIFPAKGAKSYVTAPGRCGSTRKWRFGVRIANFDGPAATAHDNVRCRKG